MKNGFRNECMDRAGIERSDGRCLIIGEVAQSHDGSLGMAHAFIDAIAAAGADAIKFQTHFASEESTPDEPWRVRFSPQDVTRYDYWRRMEFTSEQWLGLKLHADEKGLLFMSTPFSDRAASLLREIGMRVWKVASGEVCNLPLLKTISDYRDPVILSSGLSDWTELGRAVEIVKSTGCPLAVLQCTTEYPCPPENVGLNVLDEIRSRFHVPTGLSDHTGKIFAGLAAATLGAEVVEVHVTLSKVMFGPDVPASVTADELSIMVDGIRSIERMISTPINKLSVSEGVADLRKVFTKSVVAGTDLSAGTVLEASHLKLKKPGTGVPAAEIEKFYGRTLLKDVCADEMLSFADLAP